MSCAKSLHRSATNFAPNPRRPSRTGSVPDGIVVKEVLLRDVHLPAEYAKGLEGLLLKEQESERMEFETEISAKQVRIAELQAESREGAAVETLPKPTLHRA